MCVLAVLSKNKCGIKLIISFPFEAKHTEGIAWFLARLCKHECFTQCHLPKCLAAVECFLDSFFSKLGANSQILNNLCENFEVFFLLLFFLNLDSRLRKTGQAQLYRVNWYQIMKD